MLQYSHLSSHHLHQFKQNKQTTIVQLYKHSHPTLSSLEESTSKEPALIYPSISQPCHITLPPAPNTFKTPKDNPTLNHHVSPRRRALLSLPLPLLQAQRRHVCLSQPTRASSPREDRLSRVPMLEAFGPGCCTQQLLVRIL